jgi:hypothetical protein
MNKWLAQRLTRAEATCWVLGILALAFIAGCGAWAIRFRAAVQSLKYSFKRVPQPAALLTFAQTSPWLVVAPFIILGLVAVGSLASKQRRWERLLLQAVCCFAAYLVLGAYGALAHGWLHSVAERYGTGAEAQVPR